MVYMECMQELEEICNYAWLSYSNMSYITGCTAIVIWVRRNEIRRVVPTTAG